MLIFHSSELHHKNEDYTIIIDPFNKIIITYNIPNVQYLYSAIQHIFCYKLEPIQIQEMDFPISMIDNHTFYMYNDYVWIEKIDDKVKDIYKEGEDYIYARIL